MPDLAPQQPRPRVLSGMRPTGRLHLGNYMGALFNWVQLQDDSTTATSSSPTSTPSPPTTPTPQRCEQSIRDVALDFLAAGLDPERSTVFIQSHVPQHAELFTLFSMFTPLPWLERVPTYKDQQEQLREKDLNTYGFLGYPLLQAADILLYQPDFVPVGQDQVAHVELTREVARRFNAALLLAADPRHRRRPGPTTPTRNSSRRRSPPTPSSNGILPEPQVLLTPCPKLPGLDGRKMSQELRQHPHALRARGGPPRQTQDHGHRPRARSPHRPGQPGDLPRRRPPQGLLLRRDPRRGMAGLHDRRYRLHPVQGLARRHHRPRDHADPGAPPRRSKPTPNASTPSSGTAPPAPASAPSRPSSTSARPWVSSNSTCQTKSQTTSVNCLSIP